MPNTTNTGSLVAPPLNARYQEHEFLGNGSFGTVYKVNDTRLEREVAIKQLRSDLTRQEIEHFIKEAKTASQLNHPNIVKIFDADFAGDVPYIVMEFCPKGNLLEKHPLGKPVELDLVVEYTEQIASALQYVHDKKIVHRDVKPQNLLFNSENRLLLSDFGIALTQATIELLRTQVPIGSRPFVAPEQEDGKASYKSDQYSLAMVSYRLLIGKQLSLHDEFDGQSPQIARVSGVLRRALSNNPNDRYPSIREFAEEFRLAAITIDPGQPPVFLKGVAPGSATEQTVPEEVLLSLAVPAQNRQQASLEESKLRKRAWPKSLLSSIQSIIDYLETPKLLKRKRLRLHKSGSVFLSPDGKVLWAGPQVSEEKMTFRFINLETYKVLFRVMSAKDQYLLADMATRSFGKSQLLAFAYNNANRLMTLRRDFVVTESNHMCQGCHESVCNSDGIGAKIEVFNLETGRLEKLPTFNCLVESLHFSPDDKLLLIKEKDSFRVQIVDLETGKKVTREENRSHYLLPGSKMLQIDKDHTAEVIDLDRKKQLFRITDMDRFTVFPAKQLLSTFNTDSNVLRIISLETGKVLVEVQRDSSYSLSPCCKWLGIINNDKKGIQVFRIETGKEERAIEYEEPFSHYFFSPDDTLLVTVRDSLRITTVQATNLETGKILAEMKLRARPESWWGKEVSTVEFSPENKLLALISTDKKSVMLISLDTGTVVTEVTNDSDIEKITFSSDSKLFALTCKKHTLVASSLTGGKIVQVGHPDEISDICFLPDKQYKFYIATSDSLYMYKYRPTKLRSEIH